MKTWVHGAWVAALIVAAGMAGSSVTSAGAAPLAPRCVGGDVSGFDANTCSGQGAVTPATTPAPMPGMACNGMAINAGMTCTGGTWQAGIWPTATTPTPAPVYHPPLGGYCYITGEAQGGRVCMNGMWQ